MRNFNLGADLAQRFGGKAWLEKGNSWVYQRENGEIYTCRATTRTSISLRPAVRYPCDGCVYAFDGKYFGVVRYGSDTPQWISRKNAVLWDKFSF